MRLFTKPDLKLTTEENDVLYTYCCVYLDSVESWEGESRLNDIYAAWRIGAPQLKEMVYTEADSFVVKMPTKNFLDYVISKPTADNPKAPAVRDLQRTVFEDALIADLVLIAENDKAIFQLCLERRAYQECVFFRLLLPVDKGVYGVRRIVQSMPITSLDLVLNE